MNFQLIYNYRFKDVDISKKNAVWREIARFIYDLTGKPQTVLDPAGGMCEFINNVPSAERWTVDPNAELVRKYADKNVKVVTGNATDAPTEYFDLVFVSNYLEHLDSQKDVAVFLSQMFEVVKAGGYICVMGPNFRVAWREYFDFADHTVCLTELGAAEHIIGAGFTLKKVIPRFLPLSFRGRLPANKILIQAYLNMPVAWRFFGKQFLIVGRK